MTPSTHTVAAFRALERALVRRRLKALDPRLRIELAAIASLAAGFLFWQARIPLDGLARRNGETVVAAVLFGVLAVLAAGGGAFAGARHAVRLTRTVGAPPWLALPIPARDLARHLAWGSGAPALLALIPATAFLAAGHHLIPLWWLAMLGAAFVWMLVECVRLGCAMALRIAAGLAEARPGRSALERVLMSHSGPRSTGRHPGARWGGGPAWLALCRKDLALSLRPTPSRRRATLTLVLAALSVAAWWLPLELRLRHFTTFALALLAASALAEWLIAIIGSDPFPVLRSLPIGVGAVWGARAGWAAAGAAALVAAQAIAAHSLAPAAQGIFLTWLGCATLAIGLLGANYGVTLYPRADHAQRVLSLSLALAMAASLMIPLFGWVLLLTAVLHSARRIPRWNRLEDA